VKIAVFGAGAVGGAAGALLARAGHEVSLLGRGAHLEAMRANGLRILRGADDYAVRIPCPSSPAAAGKQDAVMIAVKAQATGDAAEAIQPMLGPDTVVITAQNGIPWWYFQKLGGGLDGTKLGAVDPDGRALRLIGVERCVGCVVTGAFDVSAPGVIKVGALARYAIGEPQEGVSPRLEALSRAFTTQEWEVPAKARLREDVWFKLLGNVSYSMICVLTGGNMAQVVQDPATRALAASIMAEAYQVAEALGIPVDAKALAARLEESTRMSTHKPSTLVDLERGRPMEIDAICGAVCEIARLAGVATPIADMIYALVRGRAVQTKCYPDNPDFVLRYSI
jgi:2-dehydropantoate 2-reductase